MRAPGSVVRTTGVAALGFSLLYLLTDVIEVAQGGFSDGQLVLTLIAEAAIPFFVWGLYVCQRPSIGGSGRWGAAGYALAYVAFTASVIYALADGTPDYDSLSDDLGAALLLPGALMVVSGIAFGTAVVRAGVLPGWTGWLLGVGVVAVAATQGAGDGIQLVAAAARDLAFAGMGAALLARQGSLAAT
jgi:hypothetical protein